MWKEDYCHNVIIWISLFGRYRLPAVVLSRSQYNIKIKKDKFIFLNSSIDPGFD